MYSHVLIIVLSRGCMVCCSLQGFVDVGLNLIGSKTCVARRLAHIVTTVQYSTVQYSTVQYSTVQYSAVWLYSLKTVY